LLNLTATVQISASTQSRFSQPSPKSVIPDGLAAELPTARASRAIPRCARPGLCVLLAEDDGLNRKITAALLARAGYKVIAVGDGRAAVLAAASPEVDVVLMDVEMPIMDGVTAAREIDAMADRLGRRLPIIAFTGHALNNAQADRLAANFDGHVAKPFQIEALIAEIDRVITQIGRPASPPPFDRNLFLHRVGGDEVLLGELVGSFLEDLPARLDAIQQALRGQDGAALARVAHTLRGALLSLAAAPAAEAATALESSAAGPTEQVADRADALRRELARLVPALTPSARLA
jgi:two-component system, sensor histidine kinase and response regulator